MPVQIPGGYKAIRRNLLEGLNELCKTRSFVVLAGETGAGKTTLLKFLIGLLQPSYGTIRLKGKSIHRESVSTLSRKMAYLPQVSDDLLFAESVYDELRLTLANHNLSEQDLPWSINQLEPYV